MHTRILSPVDGSVPARKVLNIAHKDCSPEPSIVSSLVDGLEAETQAYRTTIHDGVQQVGGQTSSLPGKPSTAETTLAIADTRKINPFAGPTAVPAHRAG